MRGHAPVTTNARQAARDEWLEPMRDGANKHRRFIWIKRGGTASSGSGPTGYKATRRALLARGLADRPLVAQAETARQAVARARKHKAPAIIWPDAPSSQSLAIYHG